MTSDQCWEALVKGPFIIAEIGKGFIQHEDERSVEENLKRAIDLVDLAKQSGATAVKFQTHNVEDEQADIAVEAPHFKGADRLKWVTRNTRATPFDTFWAPLKKHCDQVGITFFSTPMSRGAAEILAPLDVPLWKVGSGDILDFVLLDYLRRTGKSIIISSGMSTLEEVEKAVQYIKEVNPRVALMHCVSKYPCPPEELNLRTVQFFKKKFGIPVGFSDHSLETESGAVAVALGATIVEKHFSDSRTHWGSDHKVSLLPQEFRAMADLIQSVASDENAKRELLESELGRSYLGKEDKIMLDGESQFRQFFRKTLVASREIKAGEKFTPEMLWAKRPQGFLKGLPSEAYPRVLEKEAQRNIPRNEPIAEELLNFKDE